MVLEHALLTVHPTQIDAFEAAFVEARPLIAAQPGFVSLRLERGIETPNTYVLLVEWTTLEAHTEGFRRSPEFDRWRELLHHFYDPKPTVEHFEAVVLTPTA